MLNQQIQLDSTESVFFARQLENIKKKTYDTKQKQLKAFSIIPITTDVDSGADVVTFRTFTQVGFAKFGSDYMTDSPRASAYGTETKRDIHAVRNHYGYSIQEIRRAAKAGTDLTNREALAARRAQDETVNRVAFFGDSELGFTGLLNNANATSYTVIGDGTGSAKTFASKDADKIIRDITGMVTAVVVATNARELPDTILMPITQYNYIANTPRSSTSDKTILKYILENNPFIKKIDWLSELATAGVNGTARMMAFVNDEDHISLEIPQPFEQFPPMQKGLGYIVECHSRCAGTLIYYPASIAYGDGI